MFVGNLCRGMMIVIDHCVHSHFKCLNRVSSCCCEHLLSLLLISSPLPDKRNPLKGPPEAKQCILKECQVISTSTLFESVSSQLLNCIKWKPESHHSWKLLKLKLCIDWGKGSVHEILVLETMDRYRA